MCTSSCKSVCCVCVISAALLEMEAEDCAHWMGKFVLDARNMDSRKYTPKVCMQKQSHHSFHIIQSTEGCQFTPNSHASPCCCLLHLGSNAIEPVIALYSAAHWGNDLRANREGVIDPHSQQRFKITAVTSPLIPLAGGHVISTKMFTPLQFVGIVSFKFNTDHQLTQ